MATTMEIKKFITDKKPIAPLAILRIAFGAVMLISTIRFVAKGWVDEFYVKPAFHFGFLEWLRPLPALGMYVVFGVMALGALCILLGLFYRAAVLAFLFSFTYVELLDKTYYLNHYYFVSVFTLLLLLVPANRYWSLDVVRKPVLKAVAVPAWTILIFQLQLLLVYFFAGISKLTVDWLIDAQPLRIWLPANSDIPLFRQVWVAYAFCWLGAAFDLSVGFFLLWRKSRPFAYAAVVVFHLLTAWLFKIGMFPFIMIAATLVFFPFRNSEDGSSWEPGLLQGRALAFVLVGYFGLQLLLPFRYMLYPGKLLWTEEGYRFSWRVMLMEKGGTAFFYVEDTKTGKKGEVNNREFLTPFQDRMMATQPDMILQYAHYLEEVYSHRGIVNPRVTVESYVTLNGSGSRLFIDSSIDLGHVPENFLPKKWILPFQVR